MYKFVIDVDNTICLTNGMDYKNSIPDHDIIKKINKLYDNGNIIIMATGRHWNFLDLTITQLKSWGLKYHTLVMGVPVADYYVNDKNILPEAL